MKRSFDPIGTPHQSYRKYLQIYVEWVVIQDFMLIANKISNILLLIMITCKPTPLPNSSLCIWIEFLSGLEIKMVPELFRISLILKVMKEKIEYSLQSSKTRWTCQPIDLETMFFKKYLKKDYNVINKF